MVKKIEVIFNFLAEAEPTSSVIHHFPIETMICARLSEQSNDVAS